MQHGAICRVHRRRVGRAEAGGFPAAAGRDARRPAFRLLQRAAALRGDALGGRLVAPERSTRRILEAADDVPGERLRDACAGGVQAVQAALLRLGLHRGRRRTPEESEKDPGNRDGTAHGGGHAISRAARLAKGEKARANATMSHWH